MLEGTPLCNTRRCKQCDSHHALALDRFSCSFSRSYIATFCPPPPPKKKEKTTAQTRAISEALCSLPYLKPPGVSLVMHTVTSRAMSGASKPVCVLQTVTARTMCGASKPVCVLQSCPEGLLEERPWPCRFSADETRLTEKKDCYLVHSTLTAHKGTWKSESELQLFNLPQLHREQSSFNIFVWTGTFDSDISDGLHDSSKLAPDNSVQESCSSRLDLRNILHHKPLDTGMVAASGALQY